MKTCSHALVNMLLNNNTFKICDLITITLTNGVILRYTSLDRNVVYDGNTYLKDLNFKRGNLSQKIGINVDSLDFTIFPKPENLIGTLPLLQCFRNGTFDGAKFQLDKAFFTDWTTEPEVLEKWFYGEMCTSDIGESEISTTINSETLKLNKSLPRLVYQPSCQWTLYDSNTCKVNKESYSSTGIVNQTSTETVIKCNLTKPDNYFNQGVLLFQSGNNTNIKRTIKNYTVGQITLSEPLLYAPVIGDSIKVYRGCGRTSTDCNGIYNNLANTFILPYVPEPDSVY